MDVNRAAQERQSLLDRTVFNVKGENILSDIVVHNVRDVRAGADSKTTTYLLVITVGTNKESKDGYAAPIVHRVKCKSATVFHLKKSQSLQKLRNIECPKNDSTAFSLHFSNGKIYDWVSVDSAARHNFLWWVIQSCRYVFYRVLSLFVCVFKNLLRQGVWSVRSADEPR